MGNFSYAYAMGRIRAVERKMLGRNHFDRMIETGSAEDAYRILREAGYGGAESESLFPARDYERLLDTENEKLSEFITEISPEPRLLSIFLLRYDYHNLKVLLKTEFSGAVNEPSLSRSGVMEPEKLAGIIRDKTLYSLPAPMASGVRDAQSAFLQSASIGAPDPQVIDIRLDRAMHVHMSGEAGIVGNRFMENLIKIYIDLANINAFLRTRSMGKDIEFLREALIPGGTVSHSVYERFFGDSIDGFISTMQNTDYSPLCGQGLLSYQTAGQLTIFELDADNYVNSYIKKAKLYPGGLEVIAAYYIARQAEFKNIRIVMVGKVNGIAQDVIRERLRECYV